MKNKQSKIIVVCGPTGSGKTGLATALCQKFNGEIINADSRQVYREMDIGTAKGLDVNDKLQITNVKQITNNKCQKIQGILIHLVDIIEPNEKYNVGQFKKDAESAIADIISRGKVPFVVGGTGLYIDSVVDNFQFPIPSTRDNFQSISNIQYLISENDFTKKTLQDLVELLEKLDPQALTVVDLKNRRRVERAIEVCLTTGTPFTQQRTKGERQYEVLKLAPKVSLDREKLYEKINKRVGEMIDEGLEDEVKMLAEKYGWESEAMTGIGYREWREYLENDKCQISNVEQNPNDKYQITKEDVIEEIRKDTRNYAKRQITWFKRDKEINYVELKESEKLVEKFLGK